MAFPKLRTTPETTSADTDIPPIEHNPAFAAAMARLRLLSAHRDGIARDLEIWALEGHFASGAHSRKTGQQDGNLWNRLEALRTQARAAKPPPPAPDQPPEIALALALVQGDAVPEPDSRDVRRRKLDLAASALGAGIRAQTLIVDELREELSVDMARTLRAEHDVDLRALLAALRQVAAQADRIRGRRARLAVAGYSDRPDELPVPPCAPATLLGSAAHHDSQLNTFARILENLGVSR